jgi:hypothetical protein
MREAKETPMRCIEGELPHRAPDGRVQQRLVIVETPDAHFSGFVAGGHGSSVGGDGAHDRRQRWELMQRREAPSIVNPHVAILAARDQATVGQKGHRPYAMRKARDRQLAP